MTNEKEWWKDEAFYIITSMNEHGEVTGEEPDIEKIVAEAMRRGEMNAWSEAKKIIEERTPRELDADEYDEDTECSYCRNSDPDCGCEACESLGDAILGDIDAKLTSLKTP